MKQEHRWTLGERETAIAIARHLIKVSTGQGSDVLTAEIGKAHEFAASQYPKNSQRKAVIVAALKAYELYRQSDPKKQITLLAGLRNYDTEADLVTVSLMNKIFG
jgi:hypothetical protein